MQRSGSSLIFKTLKMNHLEKLNHLSFLSLIILIFFAACSEDNKIITPLQENENNQILSRLPLGDYKIQMSYDMTTFTYAQAANSEKQGALTPSEQTLGIPGGVGCHVEIGVLETGEMVAEIQMTHPGNIPSYPSRTIGVNRYSEEFIMDKMTIQDGLITTYNSKGEVITQGAHNESAIAFYQNIINSMLEIKPLTVEQMSAIIDGMKEAGFDIRSTDLEYLDIMKHTYDDGSYSEVILNKELYLVSGQANYNAEGELQTKSYFSFEGEPGNPELKSHRFVTHFTAPLSEIKMAIVKHSIFENFSLNIN